MFSRIFMMIIFATTALGMGEEEITYEDTDQAPQQPLTKRQNAFLVEGKYQKPSLGRKRIIKRILKRAAAKVISSPRKNGLKKT